MTATISSRSEEAGRRPGPIPGQTACLRIRGLPIVTDIVQWIREGHSSAEVARRIHANGFLEEVTYDLLRQEVTRYVKVVMAPGDALAPAQMSPLQQHSAAALESSVGELLELGDLYRMQKQMLCVSSGLSPGVGTVGHGEVQPPTTVALPTPGEGGLEAPPQTHEAGLHAGVRPKTFRDVRELMAEMRQTLRIHGGLRERLGGLERGEDENRQATREERMSGVIKSRFAGRADVQEALLDPRRRTKILGVLHKFLTSERSQDAAAASLAGELVSLPDE
jgi:hypothetical protein